MVQFIKPLREKRVLILVLLIVTLAVAVTLWIIRYRQKVTTIPATNTTTPTAKNSASGSSSPAPNSDKNPGVATAQNQNTSENTNGPAKPYGSFVSNHRPSVSGTTAPSSMQSVCSGTPGAKCYISFTQGNETRKLPEQTIANDGSTIWDWDINSAGITTGTWEIKAVSTLNGKTETAGDTLKLEVQP